jgi:hypothetical protein
MGFLSHLFGFSASKKTVIKEEINIMDAINAHIRWKVRLEKYLDGSSEEKLDYEIVSRDDQCALGKWIHGSALRHLHDDEWLKILREDHAQFHLIAGKVVSNVQANNMDVAASLMKGEYLDASRKVVRALIELNKILNA